jgi:SAM-dependent methyltransferase
MANEFRTSTAHSGEYFGDTRDHWWNLDYLALIARRLGLDAAREVLDVGCGVGHWGQLLAKILPPDARVCGVDPDPGWVEKAAERAARRGLANRCQYRIGAAEGLPFADGAFDLVTCQTVLIHIRAPKLAIAEMIRVTRPGGIVLAAEPNNVASSLVSDSLSCSDPIDDVIKRARFQLICERGKAALGEGNNSVGDLIPGFFAANGLREVQVWLSDKVATQLPPYENSEQRALIEEAEDFRKRDFWIWSREDTLRFFLAGGGSTAEFGALWQYVTSGDAYESMIAEMATGSYANTGATIMYVVSGRKARR